MSFFSAIFVTLLMASFALLFLYRQRTLGLKAKCGGLLAIIVAASLFFAAMFYVFVEYIYNQGPDDWGVIGFARAAIDDKLGTPWAKLRILQFSPSFSDAYYKVGFLLPDGRQGLVICHLDYTHGNFYGAEIQVEEPAK